MLLKKYSTKTFLSTLNFVLAIVGYLSVAAIFLPSMDVVMFGNEDLSSVTQVYTIPYRVFALFLSLFVLFQNWNSPTRMNSSSELFIIFYILWIIRLFVDLFLRTDIKVIDPTKTILFTVTAFVYCLSIVKSIDRIDFNLAKKAFFYIIILDVVFIIVKNPLFIAAPEMIEHRMTGSVGLNSISVAILAGLLFLLSVYLLKNEKNNMLKKIILVCIIVFSLFILTRAGSRGPLISLVAPLSLLVLRKDPSKMVVLSVVLFIIILLFKDYLFSVLSDISPVLAERLSDKNDVNTIAREQLYSKAIDGFTQHPLFGYAHGVVDGGFIRYPHNTLLEAFNGLGIFGGIIYIILIVHALKKSLFLVRNNVNYWVAFFALYVLTESIFSGCFYGDGQLAVLWISVLAMKSSSSFPVDPQEIILK